MKFHGITHSLGLPDYQQISDTHWKLGTPYWTRIHTSEGVLHSEMGIGWVTDKRSGSRVVDLVIPKTWTPDYDALICTHDFFWSGHVSRALADWCLLHGLQWCGISSIRAHLAYAGVRVCPSGYYELDAVMPLPYTNNRALEHFTWEPR